MENAIAIEEKGLPVTATSPSGGALTYSLGGADVGLFAIDADTRQISVFAGTVPGYSAHDNVCEVTVTAADSSDASATVAMTNVDVPEIANDYDADDNEIIDRNEAISALADYFRRATIKE